MSKMGEKYLEIQMAAEDTWLILGNSTRFVIRNEEGREPTVQDAIGALLFNLDQYSPFREISEEARQLWRAASVEDKYTLLQATFEV